MDADTTTDWRGLSANLANAAHRLRLKVVNLASDPSIPEAVRRSPWFLAAVRDAELVEAVVDQWREAERTSSAELVVRVGAGGSAVTFRTDAAKAWLFDNLLPGWTLSPADNTVTMDAASANQLAVDAKADNLVVVVVEA